MTHINSVHIIGGGLTGSEAAWQIARQGVPVTVHTIRPVRGTDKHLADRPTKKSRLA